MSNQHRTIKYLLHFSLYTVAYNSYDLFLFFLIGNVINGENADEVNKDAPTADI